VQVRKDLRKVFPDRRRLSAEDRRAAPGAGETYGDVVAGTGPAGVLSVPFESTDLTS
jgi:hypothetical protein